MNVVVYLNASYPFGNATSNRVHQICKSLQANNVHVKIIITNPTESNINSINNLVKGNFEGIDYQYISKTTFRKKNLLFRKAVDYFCYLKTLCHVLFGNKKTDFILIIGGAFFDFRLFIPILAKIINVKTILEINEYPFVNEKNSILKTIKNKVFFSSFIYQLNGFIVISNALKNLLNSNKINENKIIKVPILFDEPIENLIKNDDFNYSYIFHSGSIFNEEKDGMLGCLKAFKKAKNILNINLKFLIATHTNSNQEFFKINQFINKNNLNDDVIFLGNLSSIELKQYYKNASLAIINKANSTQNIFGFATKISEYVAFKIPLIVTNVGEINNYFSHNFNAIFVAQNNIDELAKSIVYLIQNKDKAQILAQNAYKLTETEFNPVFQGNRMIKFLSNL